MTRLLSTLLPLLLLLTAGTGLNAQDVSPVRKKPTADAVKTAKEIVDASRAAPITMPYGGYALVPMEIAADAYIVPGSNDCLDMEIIPKGVARKFFAVLKDNPGVWKFVTIPADDKFDRIRVSGIENGTATIIWHTVVDGKSVVVDAKVFNVGKQIVPKPDDPPIVPIDDALTQKLRIAANADYTAGKSDKKILLPLAEIFSAAGGSEPFPPAVITVADLDNLLYQARLFAKLPPPETAYPTLRNTAIREVIYAALGVDANSGAVKLTDAMKVKAKEIFGKIAASLEILSK